MSKVDEDFAAAGWTRPPLIPSHKSSPPDPIAPINLAFRLRQILGVGVRSEAVRVLLTTDAPLVNAQTLARSTGYAKRNVHEALAGLEQGRRGVRIHRRPANSATRPTAPRGRPCSAARPTSCPPTARGPSCSVPSDAFSAGPLSPSSRRCRITYSPAVPATYSKPFTPTWPSPASP